MMRQNLKLGIIAGLLQGIIIFLLYGMSRTYLSEGSLPTCAVIAGIASALISKQRQQGRLSFAQAMESFVGTFLMGLLITTIATLILYELVDPDLIRQNINIAREGIISSIKNGTTSKETLANFDKGQRITGPGRTFFYQSIGATTLFAALGMILGIIVSLALKRDKLAS